MMRPTRCEKWLALSMSRFPGARRIALNRDRDFIDEPPSGTRRSAPDPPRRVLARLAGEPKADRYRDAALDRRAVPALRDEAPALAHGRHRRVVERREAGGAEDPHIRRTPVGRDQDLEENDALLAEPARHQRVRRERVRAVGDARPAAAVAPAPVAAATTARGRDPVARAATRGRRAPRRQNRPGGRPPRPGRRPPAPRRLRARGPTRGP